ncbi:MAG: pyridoxamine 5'-phosphate oxidase family protein [Deltaproteobacteria bacterium]|nr:pyridoxamine 5'-phosphate oxidase family protein [Deltaproteobacteria bacterium]
MMAIQPNKVKTPHVTVPNNEVCEKLMGGITEGVLVMSRDDMPYAVPMNHTYRGGKIYLHCGLKGRKLDIIRNNPHVCFVAYRYIGSPVDDRGYVCHSTCESVIAYGTARVVTGVEERREMLQTFVERFQPGRQVTDQDLARCGCIVIDVEHMTVRREAIPRECTYWEWSPR